MMILKIYAMSRVSSVLPELRPNASFHAMKAGVLIWIILCLS
jgi:hypothetical protein